MNLNKPATIIDGRSIFNAKRKSVEQERAARPVVQGKNTDPKGAA